jgi:hypothetical protein
MYLRAHPKRENDFNERRYYRTQDAVYGNGFFLQSLKFRILLIYFMMSVMKEKF